jgi:hypothetical protein
LTLSLLVTAALATPALAGWEEELAEQIEYEHDCKVAFLSRITERTVEGHEVVRVTVHCRDKRSFEAFRPEESHLFLFTETTNSDA